MKLLSIIFCFPLFFLISNSLSAQKVIYVDISNNSGVEDGTVQHPYNTIREGVSAASAGDWVKVGPGVYIPDESWSGIEHCLFLKAGVKLSGDYANTTIISGILVDQENSSLADTVENLRFNEFHFSRGPHQGPFPGNTEIQNCSGHLIIIECSGGIAVNDTTPGANYGFLIRKNDLGNDGSIEFNQGSGISHITASDNSCGYIQLRSGGGYTYQITGNNVQTGIFDRSGANTTSIVLNVVENGMIYDFSGGNEYGIEDEVIANNTISCRPNSPAFEEVDEPAAILAKSRSVTILNNQIYCTYPVSGIRSYAGAPCNIVENVIHLDEVNQASGNPEEGPVGIYNYSGKGEVRLNYIEGGRTGYYSKAATTVFAQNEIKKSFTGFYSKGSEVVHHNTIIECHGDGVILDGVKGPVYSNFVNQNAGSGIRVILPQVDLGSGTVDSPGLNMLTGNGNYDLYIESSAGQADSIFAKYNVWDHGTAEEISQFDIYDASDDTSLTKVKFTPFGTLGLPKSNTAAGIFNLRMNPNPAGECTFVSWNMDVRTQVKLCILDCSGRVVKELADTSLEPGEYTLRIDLGDLKNGLYLCRLCIGGFNETLRLVHTK